MKVSSRCLLRLCACSVRLQRALETAKTPQAQAFSVASCPPTEERFGFGFQSTEEGFNSPKPKILRFGLARRPVPPLSRGSSRAPIR